jgi:hypothetical protein
MMPLWLAGAAAVVIAVLAAIAFARAQFGLGMLIVALAVLMGAGGAILFDRSVESQSAAERLALMQRQTALAAQALAPGSPLGCLDGAAGETVETACEKLIFGRAGSTAAAVAFMAARLSLLADALTFSRQADPATAQQVAGAFGGLRRAVELDRYGLAAQVLAEREGCTADKCPLFALLNDSSVLKANLKARAFASYVARYAPQWSAEPAAPAAEAMPPAAAGAQASLPPAAGPDPHKPVDEKYDFPSAASIPPVSIMNAEPPRTDTGTAAAGAPGNKAESSAASSTSPPPVPPHRPQNRTAAPEPR